MPSEPVPTQTDDGDGALSWVIPAIVGGLTLYVAYRAYQRYSVQQARLKGSPTYPGRVVGAEDTPGNFGRLPQGVPLNPHVGDETIEMALQRVRSRAGVRPRQTREMSTVEERIGEIARLIHEGSRDDDIKRAAQAVVTRKSGGHWKVAPKDYPGEGDAMFLAVMDPQSPLAMRYTLDHPTVDEFGSASRGKSTRAGDCDDGAIYLGSLLASIGHRPELVIMQAKGADNWSHILIRDVTNLDDGTGAGSKPQYRYYDPSMQDRNGFAPPGWAPPGLEAALAGFPGSGICQKAQAFRIF